MTTNPDDVNILDALEFYANDANYDHEGGICDSSLERDRGRQAKAAIAAYEKRRAEPRRKSPKHIDDHV